MSTIICYICGNEEKIMEITGQYILCQSCVCALKSNIAMKCITCGSWGFILKDSTNLFRLISVGAELDNNICNLNYCPNCSKSSHDLTKSSSPPLRTKIDQLN